MTNQRKVIVHIATSADGYIARTDGDLEWRPLAQHPQVFTGWTHSCNQSIRKCSAGRPTTRVCAWEQSSIPIVEPSSSRVIRVQKMLRLPSNSETSQLACS